MPKFRKKPVVIEARQWLPADDAAAKDVAWWAMDGNPDTLDIVDDQLRIRTLEGVMVASPGWWVIKGVKGEFYPCDPDIFELTYEAVGECSLVHPHPGSACVRLSIEDLGR